jgi:hypothetical protein
LKGFTREVVQRTYTPPVAVTDGGRLMSDKLRALRERTWWEGERFVVEGERRKGNRIICVIVKIIKIDVLSNSDIVYSV